VRSAGAPPGQTQWKGAGCQSSSPALSRPLTRRRHTHRHCPRGPTGAGRGRRPGQPLALGAVTSVPRRQSFLQPMKTRRSAGSQEVGETLPALALAAGGRDHADRSGGVKSPLLAGGPMARALRTGCSWRARSAAPSA
jgi:hypothetical protein